MKKTQKIFRRLGVVALLLMLSAASAQSWLLVNVENASFSSKRFDIRDQWCTSNTGTFFLWPGQTVAIYVCNDGSGYGAFTIEAWNMEFNTYDGMTSHRFIRNGRYVRRY